MFKCTIYKSGKQPVETIYGEDKRVLNRVGSILKKLYVGYERDLEVRVKLARGLKFWYEIEPTDQEGKGVLVNSLEDVMVSIVLFVDKKRGSSNVEYFSLVERSVITNFEVDTSVKLENVNPESFEINYYTGLTSDYITYATQKDRRKKLMEDICFFQALNLSDEEMLDCIENTMNLIGGC